LHKLARIVVNFDI